MPTLFHRRAFLPALALSLTLGACASGGAGAAAAPRSSSSALSTGELQADAAMDLFTLIQRRRPQWLINRAPATAQGRQLISVIMDGVKQQGSIEILRFMRAGDVQEVQYMNARDATTRYGTDMMAGAIVVLTKR